MLFGGHSVESDTERRRNRVELFYDYTFCLRSAEPGVSVPGDFVQVLELQDAVGLRVCDAQGVSPTHFEVRAERNYLSVGLALHGAHVTP